jgi:hypothetical protein
MKRPPQPIHGCPGLLETIGQRFIGERNDLCVRDLDVAVKVPNQMRDGCRLGDVARPDDEHVFVSRRDDVRVVLILVEQLTGMENRAGRELEREHRPIRRLDEPSHAPPIVRAHAKLDSAKGSWLAQRILLQHPDMDRRVSFHDQNRKYRCVSGSLAAG